MITSPRSGLLHRLGARWLLLLGLVVVWLVLPGCNGGGDQTSPAPQAVVPNTSALDTRVFPAASLPLGQGYAAWSVEWWRWAVSLPALDNPLLDATGEQCATAQRGAVWFLAGILSPSGVVVRHCVSVPADTALFFPLVVEWDRVQVALPLTVEKLRDLTSSLTGGITELTVEFDGSPLQNVQLLRFTSPAFSITLPQGNIFEAFGLRAGVPGTYFPVVDEGFYVMLKPLPVGEHTLTIHGEFPNFDFVLDVTYHLTVVPLTLP